MSLNLAVFSLAGGLALFIYGMIIFSNGLQMSFGEKLKDLMESPPRSRLTNLWNGLLTTLIVQSSNRSCVALAGVINAGLFTVTQAIAFILGSNIGTTINGQLAAINPGSTSLLLIAIGYVVLSSTDKSKNDKYHYIGKTILGFGIFFLGFSTMLDFVKEIAAHQWIVDLFKTISHNHALTILTAAVFTIIIQSSVATIGLVIAMAGGGLIDLNTALLFVIGANIGSTIPAFVTVFRETAHINSKRAILSNIVINVTGMLIILNLYPSFLALITSTSPDIMRQTANSHTLINLMLSVIFLPLTGLLAGIDQYLLKDEEEKRKSDKYLDELTLDIPNVALGMAQEQTIVMSKLTLDMIKDSRTAILNKDREAVQRIVDNEAIIDDLDDKIENFLKKIDQEALSYLQRTRLSVLNHAISDIERIADHVNNIGELAILRKEKKIKFSDKAKAELASVFDIARESMELCIRIIHRFDPDIIDKVLNFEKDTDLLVVKLEEKHMDRLEEGRCTPEAGPIYTEALRNLERITDHTRNIAYSKRIGF